MAGAVPFCVHDRYMPSGVRYSVQSQTLSVLITSYINKFQNTVL